MAQKKEQLSRNGKITLINQIKENHSLAAHYVQSVGNRTYVFSYSFPYHSKYPCKGTIFSERANNFSNIFSNEKYATD